MGTTQSQPVQEPPENVGVAGDISSAKRSPLRTAIALNDLALVQSLLADEHTDVNQIDQEQDDRRVWGITPLISAVKLGEETFVKELLKAGADVNRMDTNGWTSLRHACSSGKSHLVKILLEQYRMVNVTPNSEGLFMYPCLRGNNDIVQQLIHAGVNAGERIRSDESEYPLHLAAKHGEYHTVALLCQQKTVFVDVRDSRRGTPLMLACKAVTNIIETVEVLLSAGANVNAVDAHGFCPLLHASFSRRSPNFSLMSLLLKAGSELDTLDQYNFTAPNYSVIKSGHKKCLTFLYRHGGGMLPVREQPRLLEGWNDLGNVELLVRLSPEFRSFGERVLREESDRFSEEDKISLKRILRNPPTLQESCRYTVRNVVKVKTKTSIFPLLQQLPLPKVCISYLQMDTINHDLDIQDEKLRHNQKWLSTGFYQ